MLVVVNTFLTLIAVVCLIWAIALQSRLQKLELRILDVVSNLDITMSRLEHSQTSCNNTISDLHGMTTSISRALTEPARDLETLVSKRTSQ
jgi:hypothetical protein